MVKSMDHWIVHGSYVDEHYVKNNTMYGQMVGSMDHWIVYMVHMYMNIM